MEHHELDNMEDYEDKCEGEYINPHTGFAEWVKLTNKIENRIAKRVWEEWEEYRDEITLENFHTRAYLDFPDWLDQREDK